MESCKNIVRKRVTKTVMPSHEWTKHFYALIMAKNTTTIVFMICLPQKMSVSVHIYMKLIFKILNI